MNQNKSGVWEYHIERTYLFIHIRYLGTCLKYEFAELCLLQDILINAQLQHTMALSVQCGWFNAWSACCVVSCGYSCFGTTEDTNRIRNQRICIIEVKESANVYSSSTRHGFYSTSLAEPDTATIPNKLNHHWPLGCTTLSFYTGKMNPWSWRTWRTGQVTRCPQDLGTQGMTDALHHVDPSESQIIFFFWPNFAYLLYISFYLSFY